MSGRTSRRILGDAEELFRMAEEGGRHLMEGPPERRLPGLRNLFVFGEASLRQMQHLSAADPLFATWFVQRLKSSNAEPQMKEVAELRKVILREPKERREFTKVQLASAAGKEFGPRPQNARTFFSGDRLGGSGWEISIPGEAIEKYYVLLPDDLRPRSYHFESDGSAASGRLIEPLARKYLTWLREIVRYAKAAVS